MLMHEELTGMARWLVPLLIFAAVLVVGLVVRALLLRTLVRWSQKTATRVDDVVLAATRGPSALWILILALLLAFQTVHIPGEHSNAAAYRGLAALLILSITLGVSRFLGELVTQYRPEPSPERALASMGILRTFVRVAVVVTGVLVMLATLGINIAPLLGALGVGGLAAGLALQPTLSNLFAGFQIAVARQLRIGHRVRLASGEEGYVADISWRTTTLRTPANHLVIIPNSKFADSIVTNVNLPDPPVNIVVAVHAAYDSDPRRVETVLRDEARQALAELPLLVKTFDPIVRLQSFGESALQFNVIFQVQDFDAQFDVWGELHQRLFARLDREGIRIPLPARTVYLRGEPLGSRPS